MVYYGWYPYIIFLVGEKNAIQTVMANKLLFSGLNDGRKVCVFQKKKND